MLYYTKFWYFHRSLKCGKCLLVNNVHNEINKLLLERLIVLLLNEFTPVGHV